MYGDSHVKDKMVGETVLSLTWESLYWYWVDPLVARQKKERCNGPQDKWVDDNA